MARGRPKKPIDLTGEERKELQVWVRRTSLAQRLAFRAQIVLMAADGADNSHIAQKLRTTSQTVGKWRERFRKERLAGLNDEPRPGAPRRIADERIVEVVSKTLESTPPDATHWSTRQMARATGLSQSSVVKIWHTFGLKPHLSKTFKLSTDPFLLEKVHDVVGLYLNPPENAAVFSVDEKTQVQALDRTQPLLPQGIGGYIEQRTHDYERHGTTCLFAALNILTGKVLGQCHTQHRHQEFLKFLRSIDQEVPPHLDVHVILDNYGTHNTPKVRNWLHRHPRFTFHFTPTGASWINQVERFFAEITRKRIRRGTFRSVKELERAIYDYLAHHNENPKPFVWTATAEEILDKLADTFSKD
jgi:transposase